ncbi:MAG: DEAD/DEAH box helicase [Desulfarculus sp.]|nr:DEAD/DEAH box helicase [Desulfarculus sp.]
MIILHAALVGEEFQLWSETPPLTDAPSPKGKGKSSKTPATPMSPFDAGAKSLKAALGQMGLGLKLPAKRWREAIVWLPSKGRAPIPSSPLIAESPASRTKEDLASWRVTCCTLTRQEALELLCLCGSRHTLAQGVLAGPDLAYWSRAMRFAGALVARQRFLPALEKRGEAFIARWRPAISHEDHPRLLSLAQAMPPAARAISPDNAGPPDQPPVPLLTKFLAQMVDQLVRGSSPVKTTVRGHKGSRGSFDSLHDTWLQALHSSDGVVDGPKIELAEFAQQVEQWRRPLTLAESAPFRLCFRLEEPTPESQAGEDDWNVHFLLQSASDLSLLIPAETAWTARGRISGLLAKDGFQVREYLLHGLGQAAGLCPRIEASLRSATPGGYTLDAAGAHEFLTQRAAALEQAGFGVMLPAWWSRKGTKLKLSARAKIKSPKLVANSGLSLDRIVEVDWDLALGGEKITRAELEALARLKTPLVRLRGQWVEMRAEEIKTALDFWRKREEGQATLRDVVRLTLGADRPAPGLEFDGVEASDWVQGFLDSLQGRSSFAETEPPAGFQGVLRPYQARGYSWLGFLRDWGLGACLADDMGLGKTVQTLALILRDWRDADRQRRPVLLVCPASVLSNWLKEAQRFTPEMPVMVHHGLQRLKERAFVKAAREQALVVTSYALLPRDFKALSAVDWAGMVLDEAQNIKNPETKQARAARTLKADFRLALTGTPVENHVGDLWSLMEFLNPGFLGSQAQFKRSFFIPIQARRDPEATLSLKRLTGPFILRRLKTDKSVIADLPEKVESKVFCPLSKEQASLYGAVVKQAMQDLESSEGIGRKGVILATLAKLKQVCNHPTHFLGDNSAIAGRSGKLTRLMEMCEELMEVGDRALIFTQFAEMGHILKRHLEEVFGQETLFLHGAVSKKRRDEMVERFQGNGQGPPLFILSLKAGGTGLNLTKANHVFHFDRWWNPAVEDQATDRAYRIGQQQNVQVHKFVCAGTLEEKIDEMIEAKKAVAGKVVGTGEGWLTELSTDQLKQLFALRAEAVDD